MQVVEEVEVVDLVGEEVSAVTTTPHSADTDQEPALWVMAVRIVTVMTVRKEIAVCVL